MLFFSFKKTHLASLHVDDANCEVSVGHEKVGREVSILTNSHRVVQGGTQMCIVVTYTGISNLTKHSETRAALIKVDNLFWVLLLLCRVS